MQKPGTVPARPYPLEDFDYRLLDAGDFRKLERFGPHVFIRPAPQAIWPRRLPDAEWKKARGEYKYFKGKESGGEWKFFSKFPEEGWKIPFRDLAFKVGPTGFGHIGLFPEQALNWIWIREILERQRGAQPSVLNMFGYTGASTLAAAAAGASVTHIDASKASVTWARENLELSGLGDRPVRWIVDDAVKFLKREHKRGRRYDAIVMDPPTFGRGPQGEVWKIEKDLSELMVECKKVLSPDPLFILLTTHSPGFSALTMENMILTYLAEPGSGTVESGEMYILDTASGLSLPNGFYSRWSKGRDDPL
ncbi:MAG: class I SAM-dependent methyltransferase [Nitrospinae bacterium]|nr:class I SAM-dependent methyltransferase [Nitrospinota bacterium]